MVTVTGKGPYPAYGYYMMSLNDATAGGGEMASTARNDRALRKKVASFHPYVLHVLLLYAVWYMYIYIYIYKVGPGCSYKWL